MMVLDETEIKLKQNFKIVMTMKKTKQYQLKMFVTYSKSGFRVERTSDHESLALDNYSAANDCLLDTGDI